MVYRPNVEDDLCFVLMPFGHPFDGYYANIIVPAVEKAGLKALRADKIYGTQPIIQDIWEHIWKASVVVADVTNRNPNVNYELGLCHALGVSTILLTKRIDDVPFDYRHRRCIVYETDNAGWERSLSEELTMTLNATIGENKIDGLLRWPYNATPLQRSTADSSLSVENSRDIALSGISKLASLVARAYGPLGTHITVSSPSEGVVSVKDGLGIARGVRSANPIEEHGIDQMRDAAQRMRLEAGDGTKTTILLADDMIRQGIMAIAQGHHVADVITGMKQALAAVIYSLEDQAEVAPSELLLPIASTAAGGDLKIAEAIVEAVEGAGKDGILSIERSDSPSPTVTFEEGMRFQRGFLSDSFVTNPARGECVLDDCRILIFDRPIRSLSDLAPLLEHVVRDGRPLLIIAADVEGEALSTLVVNHVRGLLKCAAVRAPGRAGDRTELLQDIAVLTGGRAFTEELGVDLPAVTLADLGGADSVVVSKDSTVILGGHGSDGAVESRADLIRSKLRSAPQQEREVLQERLTNLVGRIATIRVGGRTPADVEDQLYRGRSAIRSVRSTLDYGWICGGGVALLNAISSIGDLGNSDARRAGAEAIRVALRRPFSVLVEGALKDPEQLLSVRQRSGSITVGLNTTSRELEDLVDAGILDSAHTVRSSVEVAFSFAQAILRTNVWSVPT